MSGILVTGASGFIGRQVVALLAHDGAEVHAVGTSSMPPGPAGALRWHGVDLHDASATHDLLTTVRPDTLLHLAWYTVPGQYWTSPRNYLWVESSLRLFREFLDSGGSRMVGVGSCAEYDWGDGYCSEDITRLAPATTYGVCKDAVRRVADDIARSTATSAAWARLFFLYGPGEHPQRLVPSVVTRLLRGETAPLTRGDQVRDFLHVRDAAGALIALMRSDVRGPVNIASGEGASVAEVAETAARLLGGRVELGALPSRADEPPLLIADVRRLRDEVGWNPGFSLQDGLRDTVGWWRSRVVA
jgi:nucleoside-diphosphate-sugar epimerase